MKSPFAFFGVGLLAFLMACLKVDTPQAATPEVVGLLEVRLDLSGNTTSARMVNPQALRPQTVTAYPYYTNANLVFTRKQVSFLDHNDFAATTNINTTGATRYITATFDVSNTTGTNFNNLILHAVSLPQSIVGGSTLGGTAFRVVQRGDGQLETDPNVLQKILPAATMDVGETGIRPSAGYGDLQWLLRAESDALEAQAASAILPSGLLALDYGFVVRTNATNSRTLNTGSSGKITLSYKVPKVNPRNVNPFGFVIYYAVTNQTETYSSQSLEEHGATLHNTTAVTNGVRIVPGSRLLAREDLVPMAYANGGGCSNNTIRIARTSALSSVYYEFPESADNPSEPVCFFGASGRRSISFGGADTASALTYGRMNGIADRYFVAGTTNRFGNNDFAIWKLDLRGKTDLNNQSGQVLSGQIIDIGTSSDDQAAAIAFDSGTNQKIVVAGSSNNDFAVVRSLIDGTLDTSFSVDGKAIVDLGTVERAAAVAIDSSGKIVVAGSSSIGVGANFTVFRLTSAGVMDTSFSGDGIATFSIGGEDIVTSMQLDSNGDIYVAGYSNFGGSNDMAVMRLNDDGTLDAGFSGDGKHTLDFGGDDRAWAVAVYPNSDPNGNADKLVLAGQFATAQTDFAVARLGTNGLEDITFGNASGKQYFSFAGSSNESARAVGVDVVGRLYVGGYTNAGDHPDNFAVLRLNGAGALDTSFSQDGKTIIDMNSSDDEAYGMFLRGSDVVLAGTRVDSSSDFQITVLR
jgi:uncharacterized delta-60 repeat protein